MDEKWRRTLGGNRVKKSRPENVHWSCKKTEEIRQWWRNRGDVGGVQGEKQMQREASVQVKGETVSWGKAGGQSCQGGGQI